MTTETSNLSMESMHMEHQLWINELNFNEDEIKFFEKKLTELVVDLSNKELLAKLEQFQNKFIREQTIINDYKHEIRLHEQEIGLKLRKGNDNPQTMVRSHELIREKMQSYRDMYSELKQSFFRYLTKIGAE